ITKTSQVENTGTGPIANLFVTEPLTGLSETIASLAPGASETFTDTYTISQDDMNAGNLENTATASGLAPDNSTVTASATETISGSKQPGLTLTKTASPTTFSSVGQQITYTIEVENTGNVTMTNISVTDPLTGLSETIASLASGASETFTDTYTITQDDMNSGSVEYTSAASASALDSSTVTATATETISARQQPGLPLTKTASPSTIRSPTQPILYPYTTLFRSNVTMTNISVTDPLTGLSETIASLAPGTSETFTDTYTISQDDMNAGSVEN